MKLQNGLLVLALFLVSPGCGTDVGNAGKPVTGPDSAELASIVSMEHDEVISSVNDGSDSEATPALALANLLDTPTCTTNSDGSIAVSVGADLTVSTEFGRKAKRKVQADSLSTTLDMTLSVPAALGALVCTNNKPVITWAQLGSLTTDSMWNKTRQRTVTLKADGTALNQSQTQVSSHRKVTFERVADADALTLTVRRQSSLDSTVTLQKNNETVTRSVQTLAAEPIVLLKTRKRIAGVTSVTIVSGAVQATHTDESSVILRYKNLGLSLGSSCHPTSGSIEGQVFAAGNTTDATSTFTVNFDADGATLVTADGTEEDLELESCQI